MVASSTIYLLTRCPPVQAYTGCANDNHRSHSGIHHPGLLRAIHCVRGVCGGGLYPHNKNPRMTGGSVKTITEMMEILPFACWSALRYVVCTKTQQAHDTRNTPACSMVEGSLRFSVRAATFVTPQNRVYQHDYLWKPDKMLAVNPTNSFQEHVACRTAKLLRCGLGVLQPQNLNPEHIKR